MESSSSQAKIAERTFSLHATVSSRAFADAISNDSVSILFGGDFNAPSHEDWVPEVAHRHNGAVVKWPQTLILERAGLRDSYRSLNDLRTNADYTWSPLEQGADEKFDRIDYIFYKPNMRLRLRRSFTFDCWRQDRFHWSNHSWHTDHTAVISDFELCNSLYHC